MIFADLVFIPDEKGDLMTLAAPCADAAAPLPAVDMGTTLIKMIFSLVALVALLYGTYWFLRRLIQQKMHRGTGKHAIEILEKRMLSPKTMLYIVQVEDKKVLFAESHLEIKTLETFTLQESNTSVHLDDS